MSYQQTTLMSYYEHSSITLIHTNKGFTDHEGIISKDDGVCFNGIDVVSSRLRFSITYAQLKQKLLGFFSSENDEQEIIRIVYRKPQWVRGEVF